MKKQFFLTLISFLLCSIVLAQSGEIKGLVISKTDNEPLIGVAIIVAGSSNGTVTDIDGKFTLKNVTPESILQVSYVGFEPQSITVGSNTTLNIILQENTNSLDEVVVVGYGAVKKSSMVGAISTVTAKEIEKRPITSVGAAFYGAAPGMMATSSSGVPGDDPLVRIRGFGTINSSSEPIIVVDGAIFEISLRTLNPQDIESISVLKDASATAIYGSRGANGVILVTTKQGKKDHDTFTVTVNQGINTRFIPQYEDVSPQEYYQLMYEAKRNSLVYGSNIPLANATALAAQGGQYKGETYNSIFDELKYNPFYGIDNNDIINPVTGQINPNATRLKWGDDLDWFDPMSRVGMRTDISVSTSGGTKKGDHHISVNYLDDNAWMERSYTKRLSVRANVNHQPAKWLKFGTNVTGSIVDSYNQGWSGGSGQNPFYVARIMGPIYPVYLHDPVTGGYILDSNGEKIYDGGGGQEIDGVLYPTRPIFGGNRNIVAELFADDMKYKRSSVVSRTYADLIFFEGFKFTASANITYSSYAGSSYQSSEIGIAAPSGTSSRSNRINSVYNYQQLFSYDKTFNKLHAISAVLGHEYTEVNTNQMNHGKKEQIIPGNNELDNFTTITNASSSQVGHNAEGYFFRTNYSYDQGKYILEASARRDGSSKFYRGKSRWGNFWSVGLGWTITQEEFFQKANLDFINLLKFRASYGTNGNLEGISNYAWQDIYMLNYNNQNEPGYIQDVTAPNRNLTWETQSQLSFGFDYALFNGRLRGSIDYFNKENDDLIFSVRQPASTGITSQSQNIGSLYNRGWEFEIKGDIVRQRDLTINLGISAATLTNKITKMPRMNPEIISGTKKLKVGQSIYDFWMFDFYGVDPRDGAALYSFDPKQAKWSEDECRIMENGDLVTTSTSYAAYDYRGSAIPDVYGGITTSVIYKNVSLNLAFGYSLGGKVYDGLYGQMMASGNYGYNAHKDLMNRWQKVGDVTSVPRMDNGKLSVFNTTSTRFLTDASYLTLRTAALSYSLPKSLITPLSLSNVNVNLSAENLFLLTKRKGLNPMQSFSGEVSNQYPAGRVFTLGVNVNF